ncbi:MAG: tetratricopeptide repeat protein [Chthoniobacterales bacterium]
MEPNQAAALYARGNISLGRRDLEAAIADFSEVIRCWPDYAVAYVMRGIVYEQRREPERAVASFDSAIRVAPSYEWGYLYRGYFYQNQGQPDQAIGYFSEALKIDPKLDDAYRARALAYANQRQWQAAINDWSSVLQLHERDERSLKNRGQAYRAAGHLDEAIADFSELIRITQQPVGYDLRAEAYVSADEYQKAIADYRTGREFSGEITRGSKGLPWLLATCPESAFRNGAEAVEAASEDCKRTKWQDWNCLDTLAAAYAEAGEFTQAVTLEEHALRVRRDIPAQPRQAMQERLAAYQLGHPYHEKPAK